VIGPYRSGKSFLLNQMLGVSCGGWPPVGGGARRAEAPPPGRGRVAQPRAGSPPARRAARGGRGIRSGTLTPRPHPLSFAARAAAAGQGFGVGHTRDTQTKGIWLWGEGHEARDDLGSNRTLVFVDTEGFESTARSSSYDDRIFAVAAVLSSLLIYVSAGRALLPPA
jgi:hypothetical protein